MDGCDVKHCRTQLKKDLNGIAFATTDKPREKYAANKNITLAISIIGNRIKKSIVNNGGGEGTKGEQGVMVFNKYKISQTYADFQDNYQRT